MHDELEKAYDAVSKLSRVKDCTTGVAEVDEALTTLGHAMAKSFTDEDRRAYKTAIAHLRKLEV
jgi:hypothetical protein